MNRKRKMYLNTPRSVRLAMTRVARELYAGSNGDGGMDPAEARLLLEYLKGIQASFKQEAEQSLDERLEALERALEARGG